MHNAFKAKVFRSLTAAEKHMLLWLMMASLTSILIFFRILCYYPGIFASELIFFNKTKNFDEITLVSFKEGIWLTIKNQVEPKIGCLSLMRFNVCLQKDAK